MKETLLGTTLSLAIFFAGFFLLKGAMAQLEPVVGRHLRRAVGGPLRGVLLGMLVTAVIQSSSATNAMVVGFVSAGVIRFEQAFTVVLGANVGTTLTGQIVAFGTFELGAAALVVGFLLAPFRMGGVRRAGEALAGLGGIFFGLWTLGRVLGPGGGNAFAHSLFSRLDGGPGAVLIGALVTGVVQSSSAVIGVLIGLAESGAISAEAAIAAALGSNVGTVVTTLLGAASGGREARRTAVADLVFNAAGVMATLPFLTHLAPWIALTSASAGRQVANAHTLFNLITVLIALPCLRPLRRLVERLVR